MPYNVSEVHIVVVKANEGSMTANLSWSDPGPCSDDCNFTLVFKLSAVSFGNHCMSTWQLAPKKLLTRGFAVQSYICMYVCAVLVL